MTIRKDVLANYFGTGVSAIAPILALPWYISLLGAKLWGLVSFVWILQAILGLVNAGLAQALIREISSLFSSAEDGTKRIAAILFGFERIYWGFSIATGILVACFAGVIVNGWLKLGNIPVETGKQVIYAAAIIFTVQFPASIYRTVLFGCGHQVQQNMVAAMATVFRHAGGVAVLCIHGSVVTYLAWNILAAFIETLVTAKISWRHLHVNRSELQWDLAEMRKIFALTIGLTASVFMGILTLQIDKIVLSWSLPIEQLGYYTIASTVSIGLLQVFTPITTAVLPRVVQLQHRVRALRMLNFKLLGVMLVLVCVGALCFVIFGKFLLTLWLRDVKVVSVVFPVLSLLLVGTGMNAIYSIGYVNWIATGASNKVLLVNAIAFTLSIILLPSLIDKYQLYGAAFGWLAINCVGLLMSLSWIVKGREVTDRA